MSYIVPTLSAYAVIFTEIDGARSSSEEMEVSFQHEISGDKLTWYGVDSFRLTAFRMFPYLKVTYRKAD